MGSESPGDSLEFPGRTSESGGSGTRGEGLRVPWSLGPQGHGEKVSEWAWSPGAQGQVIVPGAAAGAAAGPAGPAGCPARAPGSAGKGLLSVAATAHASGRRTGLPAAVSILLGAGGPAGEVGASRSAWQAPTPALKPLHPLHWPTPALTCSAPSAPALMAKVGSESRLWSPSAGNLSLLGGKETVRGTQTSSRGSFLPHHTLLTPFPPTRPPW